MSRKRYGRCQVCDEKIDTQLQMKIHPVDNERKYEYYHQSCFDKLSLPSPCCQQAKAEALDKVMKECNRYDSGPMLHCATIKRIIDQVKESK